MRDAFFFFICAAMLLMPSLTFAGVKVMLKNGREITVDSCVEKGDRLVCSKMGGTFDIEKGDVDWTKETGGGKDAYSGAPADDQQAEEEKTSEDVRGSEATGGQNPTASEQKGLDQRLAEITQKKKELYAEREKLVKERQQFQEDLDKAPDWMSTKQFEGLDKRNTEITEKIKRFNEEAARLSEEENQIKESRKKKD